MYYLLYKMNDMKKVYMIVRFQDDEEFDRIMNVSYVTPLLMTESLELARKVRDEYNKKEPSN